MQDDIAPPIPGAAEGTSGEPRPRQPWPDTPCPTQSNLTDEQWDDLTRKVGVILDSHDATLFAAIVELVFKHCSAIESDGSRPANRAAETKREGSS